MSSSSSGSIPSVGGAELPEATVPRSLAAGARARLLLVPTLERRTAAREAGRFPDPVAPAVGRERTNPPTPDLAPMRRGRSPLPPGAKSP